MAAVVFIFNMTSVKYNANFIYIYIDLITALFAMGFMPRYSWNTAKVGIKHHSINQSINICYGIIKDLNKYTYCMHSVEKPWFSGSIFIWPKEGLGC